MSFQRWWDHADPTDWLKIFPTEEELSDKRDYDRMADDYEILGGICEGNWKLHTGY